MGDGFSINLSDKDLKRISDEYHRLKEQFEMYKSIGSVIDHACTYFALDGFKKALVYVGLDPEIFENGIEPLE